MTVYKKNISLFETNQCGDYEFIGNDIQVTGSIWTMVYVALFGGNRYGHSQDTVIDGELNYDYWANKLFYPNNPDQQVNSRLEKLLSSIALVSGNLTRIERVALEDLQYLSYIGKITVDASIIDNDSLKLNILFLEGTEVIADAEIIWSQTKDESVIISPPDIELPPENVLMSKGEFVKSKGEWVQST